jgi:hypothetical protein
MTEVLLLSLKLSVAAIILAIGIDSTPKLAIACSTRHPGDRHPGGVRASRSAYRGHRRRLYSDLRGHLDPLFALAPRQCDPIDHTRNLRMNTMLMAAVLAVGLFVGILAMLELGRRLGIRRLASDPTGAQAGTGAVEGAVFALVGLLIAFTFSGAASRFDARRDLIVAETNAVGTAWLRLDLLPAPQPAIRDSFIQYLDARLAVYRELPDIDAARAALAKATALQATIWAQAIAAGQREGASPDAIKLLLPALNEMFDITTTRTMATQAHPPYVIYGMLIALALASALLAGFGMAGSKSRSWLHIFGFAGVMAVAVYVIIDLEFPRLGLIQVDTFDQALIELRASMT